MEAADQLASTIVDLAFAACRPCMALGDPYALRVETEMFGLLALARQLGASQEAIDAAYERQGPLTSYRARTI